MWNDQQLDQYVFEAEEDPMLGHFAVVMYLIAAVAATLVTILVVLRSPMHY